MRKRTISAAVFAVLLIALCACGSDDSQTATPTQSGVSFVESETPPETGDTAPASTDAGQNPQGLDDAPLDAISGEVVITFDYLKQSGYASNQFAVWIEDMNGKYVNTLYATRYTATGGYKDRPDSIALWVEKSGIAAMPDYYVDAISGATPQSGKQSFTWNLKDIDGETVPPGEYKIFVEGTLRWKNSVLYSCTIDISGDAATVEADADFVYAESSNQAALTSGSPENAMIRAVTASYVPNAT